MDLSHLELTDEKLDNSNDKSFEDVGILSPSMSVKANCSWSAQSEGESGLSGERSSPFTAFAVPIAPVSATSRKSFISTSQAPFVRSASVVSDQSDQGDLMSSSTSLEKMDISDY